MRLQPILLLLFVVLAVAAGYPQRDSGKAPDTPAPASDISGMYTFLEEGEFVQITIEEQDKVTGFISRYGELPTDKGAFLDQFIKKGTLAGNALSFVTEALHGVGYEFKGTVTRGPRQSPRRRKLLHPQRDSYPNTDRCTAAHQHPFPRGGVQEFSPGRAAPHLETRLKTRRAITS